MKNQDSIWLYISQDKELNVYVMEDGLDLFIPMFLWNKPLSSVKITKESLVVDVKITKNLFIKNGKNCVIYESYSSYSGILYGCLAAVS